MEKLKEETKTSSKKKYIGLSKITIKATEIHLID